MPSLGWSPSLEPDWDRTSTGRDPWAHVKLPESHGVPLEDTRRAIGETAELYREQARKNGVEMTHEEARGRVSQARARGDRDRANNNR